MADTPRCNLRYVPRTCRTALRGPRHGPDHLDDEGHGHVPDTDAPPTAEPSRHTLHANGNGHVHGEQPKYDGRRQAVAEAVMEAEAPAADSGGAVVLHVQQRGSKGGAEGRLEFLPVVLAFRDVSYYVPHPAEKGTAEGHGKAARWQRAFVDGMPHAAWASWLGSCTRSCLACVRGTP